MNPAGQTVDKSNMLYTGPHKFRLEKWISCSPFEKLLGIEIVEVKDGKSILTMPFVLKLAQGGGLAHGGALVTLADTSVAMAVKSLVPKDSRFATIQIHSEFHAPVTKGTLCSKAQTKVLKNRLIQGDAVVYTDEQKKVMTFSAVFKLARDVEVFP